MQIAERCLQPRYVRFSLTCRTQHLLVDAMLCLMHSLRLNTTVPPAFAPYFPLTVPCQLALPSTKVHAAVSLTELCLPNHEWNMA